MRAGSRRPHGENRLRKLRYSAEFQVGLVSVSECCLFDGNISRASPTPDVDISSHAQSQSSVRSWILFECYEPGRIRQASRFYPPIVAARLCGPTPSTKNFEAGSHNKRTMDDFKKTRYFSSYVQHRVMFNIAYWAQYFTKIACVPFSCFCAPSEARVVQSHARAASIEEEHVRHSRRGPDFSFCVSFALQMKCSVAKVSLARICP